MGNSKGITIASLVLGIVGCVLSWWGIVCGIIAIACAIVGLVLAIKARKANPSKMATAALILCIIGLVLAIIGTIACGICVCTATATATAIESNPDVAAQIEDALESVTNALN